MNAMKKLIYLSLLAVWCAVPAVSFAGKCAGTNINNVVSWEPSEIAKGTTLAIVRITSVVVSDDPSVAYHLISGECVGQFLTTPDGKTVGNGSCARKDKDGDVLNEEWVATDGTGNNGTWKSAGGTGKFANVTGAAKYQTIMSQGKTNAVRWVGNCQ
jgi:hypothetical protein